MTTVQTIPLDQISPNGLNIRRDLGDLEELTDSIRTLGLLEPLVVASNDDAGGYALIAGHRRYAAAGKAGLSDALCVVRDDLTTPAAQIEAMLVENLQRVDISAVEEAAAYTQLLAFPDVTVQSIAKTTGRALQTVKDRVQLAKLPEPVQARVHERTISLTDAVTLAEFAGTEHFDLLEASIGSYAFPQRVQTARRQEQRKKAEAANTRKLKKDGIPLVDYPKYGSWFDRTDKPLNHLDVEVTAEEHAKCKGHAATFDPYDADIIWVCLDPAKYHKSKTPAPTAPKQSAEDLAAEEERERARTALRDAAEVRRSLIAKLIAGEIPAPKETLGLAIAAQAFDWGNQDEVIEVMRLTPPEWDESDDAVAPEEAQEAWLLEQLTKAKPEALTRLLATNIREYTVPAMYAAEWTTPMNKAYFAFLEKLGYTPIPEELAKLNPPATAE